MKPHPSELDGLVDTWCDLVVQRGFERQPGQVARIISNRVHSHSYNSCFWSNLEGLLTVVSQLSV